jgi:hypothetical protein
MQKTTLLFLSVFCIATALLVLVCLLALPKDRLSHQSLVAAQSRNIAEIQSAIARYRSDKGSYPGVLEDLVKQGYLVKVPIDPLAPGRDSWILVRDKKGGIIAVRAVGPQNPRSIVVGR